MGFPQPPVLHCRDQVRYCDNYKYSSGLFWLYNVIEYLSVDLGKLNIYPTCAYIL